MSFHRVACGACAKIVAAGEADFCADCGLLVGRECFGAYCDQCCQPRCARCVQARGRSGALCATCARRLGARRYRVPATGGRATHVTAGGTGGTGGAAQAARSRSAAPRREQRTARIPAPDMGRSRAAAGDGSAPRGVALAAPGTDGPPRGGKQSGAARTR